MKKKIVIGLIVAAIGCSFVGCAEVSDTYTNNEGSKVSAELRKINDYLSYSEETGIVYYCFDKGVGDYATGYMSPYISKDGTYCKYENGKVVPLEEGE